MEKLAMTTVYTIERKVSGKWIVVAHSTRRLFVDQAMRQLERNSPDETYRISTEGETK
jgi:hypothetical protein